MLYKSFIGVATIDAINIRATEWNIRPLVSKLHKITFKTRRMAARWCPHHLHPHHHQHLHDDHHQVPQVDIERLPDHMLKEWETESEVKLKEGFCIAWKSAAFSRSFNAFAENPITLNLSIKYSLKEFPTVLRCLLCLKPSR